MTVHELDAPAAYPYEADLIGAVLHGYPNIPELARILTAGDFDQPAHRQIWEAILAVHRDGQGVDSATVFAKMGLGAHRLPGGATYLIDLSQQSTPVTAHNVTFYAEKIQEARLRRDIRGLGARCTQIDQSDIEPREAIKLIREWADSIETRGPDLVDLSQAALEAVIDVAENGEPNATPTPWRDLTEALGGWYPNELITFAARPGVGKSIALENVASDLACNGQAVLMFSLEMSAKELTQRRMAHTARVPLNNLRRGKHHVSEQDWQRINQAVPTLQQFPIRYRDRSMGGRITVEAIRDEAWEFARECRMQDKPLGAVIVDYCQLVDPTDSKVSRQQQVGHVTRGLKRLAGELEIPVFNAAQLNRQSMARTNPIPMLHDLREAGDIEQDSNVVILLHEETIEDGGRILPSGQLQMIVAKSRHSSQTTFTVQKYGHYSRIANA